MRVTLDGHVLHETESGYELRCGGEHASETDGRRHRLTLCGQCVKDYEPLGFGGDVSCAVCRRIHDEER